MGSDRGKLNTVVEILLLSHSVYTVPRFTEARYRGRPFRGEALRVLC